MPIIQQRDAIFTFLRTCTKNEIDQSKSPSKIRLIIGFYCK